MLDLYEWNTIEDCTISDTRTPATPNPAEPAESQSALKRFEPLVRDYFSDTFTAPTAVQNAQSRANHRAHRIR